MTLHSNILLKSVVTIINLRQNYDYYEYWSSNKWLVQEILAIINEVDKDIIMDGILIYQG